jgi:hypothetical protein
MIIRERPLQPPPPPPPRAAAAAALKPPPPPAPPPIAKMLMMDLPRGFTQVCQSLTPSALKTKVSAPLAALGMCEKSSISIHHPLQ